MCVEVPTVSNNNNSNAFFIPHSRSFIIIAYDSGYEDGQGCLIKRTTSG